MCTAAAPVAPPSPQFQRVLAALRRHPIPVASAPLAELREQFDQSALPVADDVTVAPDLIGGLPVEVLTAPCSRIDRTVVYLHGGGYVMGSLRSHRRLAGEISRASKARVVLVDYPLAPEHAFPAAIKALTTLFVALLDSGLRPRDIAVVGDSAGGGLAVATLISLRNCGRPLPAACVTISAFLDFAANRSYAPELVAADPIVTPEALARVRAMYLGGADDQDVGLMAVGDADLTGLPPLLILAGLAEVLLEDSRLLARRARACDVPVTIAEWPHMVHVWPAFAGLVPESTAAVEQIGEFLDAALCRT